jgi:PIN domain nuclease of toxin-antitoxin system
MKWKRFITLILAIFIAVESFEWTRKKEIIFLVAMIRFSFRKASPTNIARQYLFHGTPLSFSLGFKHPCFLIDPNDPVILAVNLLKTLSPTVSSDLTAALESTDRNQRFLGAIALSELELKPDVRAAAIPSLHLALEDSDPEIRDLAIVALSRSDALTVTELRDRLNDPMTRITAARAARNIGSKARPVASTVLKIALEESDVCPYVTIEDVTEKIGIEPELAVFVLRQGLKNPKYAVRQEAIERLAQMGAVATPAIPDLEAIVANRNKADPSLDDPHLRDDAAHAIQFIKGRCPPKSARTRSIL